MGDHYVRIDEQSRVIKAFSTEFEQPIEGDKLVATDAGRHYNLDLYDPYMVLKYKWTEEGYGYGEGAVVERTQEEKQPEMDAIRKVTLFNQIQELQKQLDALANLKTYTPLSSIDIDVKMVEVEAARDAAIVEYGNL